MSDMDKIMKAQMERERMEAIHRGRPIISTDVGDSYVADIKACQLGVKQWMKVAGQIKVGNEMEAAVGAAVAVGKRVTALWGAESKRAAENKERAEESAELVFNARVRRFDAAEAVRLGTLDADQAVRNYLELIAVDAELAHREGAHVKLIESLRTAPAHAVREFRRLEDAAESTVRGLSGAYRNHGESLATIEACRLGAACNSLAELGFAVVEMERFLKDHRFSEDRPKAGLEEAFREYQAGALAKLGKAS
jgi:hypothetical protein